MDRLARAIKRAAEIRENSYNQEEADKADKAAETEESFIIIDFNRFYQISLYKACNQATEEAGFDRRGTLPVYLLLKYTWNDILNWADHYSD